MQIITPAQCRAARALLNWSQPELAQRCDIHVQTISNFEKESSTPSKTTLEKILITLSMSGIILMEGDGVKREDKIVTTFEGEDALYRYLDNLYNDLKDKPGSEVLITGLKEATEEEKELRSFVEMHIKRLIDAGITERLLIKEGDKNLIAPKSWYRTIAPKYFTTTTFQLHGSKLSMQELGSKQRIVVIENKAFADAFRCLFNFTWDNAKPMK